MWIVGQAGAVSGAGTGSVRWSLVTRQTCAAVVQSGQIAPQQVDKPPQHLVLHSYQGCAVDRCQGHTHLSPRSSAGAAAATAAVVPVVPKSTLKAGAARNLVRQWAAAQVLPGIPRVTSWPSFMGAGHPTSGPGSPAHGTDRKEIKLR
eukprot:gene12474-biopygen421